MKKNTTKTTTTTTSPRNQRLAQAAQALIEILGDATAAAVAGKCQPTYGRHPADLEAADLAEVIINTMGTARFNAVNCF